jgi:hypothetical protein
MTSGFRITLGPQICGLPLRPTTTNFSKYRILHLAEEEAGNVSCINANRLFRIGGEHHSCSGNDHEFYTKHVQGLGIASFWLAGAEVEKGRGDLLTSFQKLDGILKCISMLRLFDEF